MRVCWNWQTGTFEGRVSKRRMGSSPITRTKTWRYLMRLIYKIKENDNYINVKELLKAYFNISDRLLLKLKKNKKILINGISSNINSKLSTNDIVEVLIDFEEDNSNIIPTKMDLDIIYEDDAYIVINKPAGIPIHPSMNHFTDSLSNGVRYYFDQIELKKKIRPVNRLDKNTSGLVIFAKNEYIQESLVKQMKSNIFYKEYIAICEGEFEKESGIINAPIARKENSIIERCVSESGDNAITEYEVIKYNQEKDYSIVKCILKTGRTHQIRVHMSYIGHPILGDTLYGNASELINRQALHAYKMQFIHPIIQRKVSYVAKLYNDMNNLII